MPLGVRLPSRLESRAFNAQDNARVVDLSTEAMWLRVVG